MATVDELLFDVLQLPTEERARIAHQLLLSLEGEDEDPDTEARWVEELQHRAQDVLSGKVKSQNAREFIEEVRAQMRERRGK